MKFLPLFLLVALLGCELELPVTAENVEGTWTGSYDHMPMTFVFNADKTSTYTTGAPKGGEPKIAWIRGRFIDLPWDGTWRVTESAEPELVWMVDGGMADSAFIRNVSETTLTLQFEGKPVVKFEKQ